MIKSITLVLCCLFVIKQAANSAPNRPNILFILADDLGWSDTTLFGTTKLYQTPNLESLARSGMLFSRAYSSSPLCSPTRASILSGQNPARIGITAPNCHLPQVLMRPAVRATAPANSKVTVVDSATRFDTKFVTLAERLKDAGYATGHFGKWHLGPESYSPLQQGFDVDVPHHPGPGPAGSFVAPWKFANFKEKTPGEHLEDRMGDEAVAFMESHQDAPFFLNYWQFSVHAPFDAKKDLIEKYRHLIDPSDPQHSPTYAAMVQSLDENIGKMLNALDRLGLTEKTAIIFFSDNGGNMYNQVDGTTPTSNAPLRGGKATMYEGGIRVPCIVKWPGVTPANIRNGTMIQSTDFYPTILKLLDLPPTPDHVVDGVDITPALRGEAFDRGPIFTYFPHAPGVPDNLPPSVSVCRGDWKLIRLFYDHDAKSHGYRLYDLANDPGEATDLSAEKPDLVHEMDALIDAFLTDTQAVQPTPNPKYNPHAAKVSIKKPAKVGEWTHSKDAVLTSTSEGLRVTSIGGDPWMSADVSMGKNSGPFVVKLRLKTTMRGQALLYYKTKAKDAFSKDKTVPFTLQKDDQFHDYSLTIDVSQLAAMRLDPSAGKGETLITELSLHAEDGTEVKQWLPQSH